MLALPSHCGSAEDSIDFGSIGATHDIAEADLARQLQARAAAQQRQLPSRRQAARQQALAYMQRPPGVALPPAKESRELEVFPQHDAAASSWQGQLLFINADDAMQRQWFERELLPQADKLKVVLVQGSPPLWSERWQVPVYFDQHGFLSQRLGVVALPSLLRQRRGQLLLRQIAVPR